MGDIADYLIDRMIDEAIERRVWGDDYALPRKRIITCDRCGTRGLKWEVKGDGWALYDGAKRQYHNCSVASADEFSVIDE